MKPNNPESQTTLSINLILKPSCFEHEHMELICAEKNMYVLGMRKAENN